MKKRLVIVGLISLVFLLFLSLAVYQLVPSEHVSSVPGAGSLDPRTAQKLLSAPDKLKAAQGLDKKAVAAAKANPGLTSSLTEIAQVYESEGEAAAVAKAASAGLDVNKGKLTLMVETDTPGEAVETVLASAGAAVDKVYKNMIQISCPLGKIKAISSVPGVKRVRPPYSAVTQATSEGVAKIGANTWQTNGAGGKGTKVAVLDLGFQGYQALLGTDLPTTVTAISFRADADITGGGEVHGTACAEIVHDVAPEAQLYLVNFNTEIEYEQAVDYLIAQDVDIISHSIAWFNCDTGDGTGVIDQKMEEAVASGISWFNSAGNYGNAHYKAYPDLGVDAYGYWWHQFEPGNIGNAMYVEAGETVVVWMRWKQYGNIAPYYAWYDYDLYLGDSYGNFVAGSYDAQIGDAPGYEAVGFTAPTTGFYYVLINAYDWYYTQQTQFELFTTHQLEFATPESSIACPAENDQAIAVGATNVANDEIETFSSRGPIEHTRVKPEITAPDRVSTTSYGAGSFWGTSAAAPHSAGAAALIKSVHTDYTTIDTSEFLEAGAVDLGSPGIDSTYGYGRIAMGNTLWQKSTDNPEWTTFDTSNSGLVDDNVDVIAVDQDGGKWFGTSKGISNFNGASWTTFNTSNSGLANNDVDAIAFDTADNAWIGQWGGGVSKFDGSTWTTYNTLNSGLLSNYVDAVTVDQSGDKWYGTQYGVSKFNGSTWTNYDPSNSGLPDDWVSEITVDQAGNKWFATNYGTGVTVFNGTTWTTYNTSNSGLANNMVYTIEIDQSGDKWFGTSGGASKFDGVTWTTYNTANSGLPNNTVYGIAFDNANNKWFSTSASGVSRLNGATWTTYNTSNSGLVSNYIIDMAADSYSGVWMGSIDGVSRYIQPQPTVDHFGVTSVSSPVAAGEPVGLTITAMNADNSTITDFTGKSNLSDLGLGIQPSRTGDFAAGVWTGTVTMRKPKVNNQIAAFNIFTDDIGYSNSFDVVTGPLNHLDLTPALGTAILQLNGQLSLTVQGEDVCHNPISGLEYAWTSTGGTVDPLSGSSTTYTAGTVAGTGFYVRASSGGVSADVGITVNPGPLNHIHLNPESQALQVGGGQAFDAQGEDQYNNPISGLTYTWTATGGTVFPAMGASTTYTAGTVAGTGFYVRAASGGVSTDAAITLGHGPINRVAVDPASFMLKRGEQKNLTAQAFDAYDNLDSDAEFDWLATGGVLDAATGTANKYTAGTTLGSFNVSVTSSGKEGIVPVKVVADDMITIFYDYGSSTSGIMGMYSDGSNFMSPIGLWNSGLGNWDSARSRPMIGDYNGDGRNDIIIFYDYGYENSAVMTMLNTGTTFNLPQMVWISGPGNWDANRSRPMIGDYNGDGRDDVIIFYDYGYSNSAVMTMLNNGSGFDAPQQVWISGPGNWDAARSRPMIGDYNGDTLDDVIIFYDYGYENSAVMTMLNTGTTFNAPQQVWISGPGNWDAARSRPMLGDYDGDTRDDIIIFYDYGNANSAVMTMWNTGTTFNPPLVSWISGPGNWEAGRSVVFTR